MIASKHDPDAVDAYLANLEDEDRAALGDLRALIKETVPEVEERISYGTAVIFSVGKDLVGFVARENHLSFFTMGPELAESMEDRIQETHEVAGATIHFTNENPLPTELVRNILATRLDELGADE